MLNYVNSKQMGRGIHGWLDSHFHFSFAEYYNPENIQFGVLRVLNDDIVQPETGFDTHPHQNMEILSYVVEGELTHADSMGNEQTLTRGQVQYMSAGTGVLHSEYNNGNGLLRFLQIWILPDKAGYRPNYGDYRFKLEDRNGRWLPLATGAENKESVAPIHIHQDINAYATILSKGESIDFHVGKDRQAYMVLAEGRAQVEGIALDKRDAVEIIEQDVAVRAGEGAHIVVIEMAKA